MEVSSNTELSGLATLLKTITFGILRATSRMPASQSNDFIKVILTKQDGVTKIETENASTLPTQEEVRKEEEEWKASIEAGRKKVKDHAGISWTACYDDECLVHMSDKDAEGWFPKSPRQQPPTAPHADLPREKCNRWGCQIPAHQPGKSSRTNSARKGGKKSKKPQCNLLLSIARFPEGDPAIL